MIISIKHNIDNQELINKIKNIENKKEIEIELYCEKTSLYFKLSNKILGYLEDIGNNKLYFNIHESSLKYNNLTIKEIENNYKPCIVYKKDIKEVVSICKIFLIKHNQERIIC